MHLLNLIITMLNMFADFVQGKIDDYHTEADDKDIGSRSYEPKYTMRS